MCDVLKVIEDLYQKKWQKRNDLSSCFKKLEKEQQTQIKQKKENKKDKTNDHWNRKQIYKENNFNKAKDWLFERNVKIDNSLARLFLIKKRYKLQILGMKSRHHYRSLRH